MNKNPLKNWRPFASALAVFCLSAGTLVAVSPNAFAITNGAPKKPACLSNQDKCPSLELYNYVENGIGVRYDKVQEKKNSLSHPISAQAAKEVNDELDQISELRDEAALGLTKLADDAFENEITDSLRNLGDFAHVVDEQIAAAREAVKNAEQAYQLAQDAKKEAGEVPDTQQAKQVNDQLDQAKAAKEEAAKKVAELPEGEEKNELKEQLTPLSDFEHVTDGATQDAKKKVAEAKAANDKAHNLKDARGNEYPLGKAVADQINQAIKAAEAASLQAIEAVNNLADEKTKEDLNGQLRSLKAPKEVSETETEFRAAKKAVKDATDLYEAAQEAKFNAKDKKLSAAEAKAINDQLDAASQARDKAVEKVAALHAPDSDEDVQGLNDSLSDLKDFKHVEATAEPVDGNIDTGNTDTGNGNTGNTETNTADTNTDGKDGKDGKPKSQVNPANNAQLATTGSTSLAALSLAVMLLLTGGYSLRLRRRG